MPDFLNASPLLILLALAAVAWLLDSRILKLATAAFFFGYPLMLGKTTISGLGIDQILDFLVNTIKFWLDEALNSLIEYLKQKLLGG